MLKTSIAIFANFFIDNEERFQRMKDSFYSFKDLNPKEWIINIRGNFKLQAGEFLIKELSNNLHLSHLESKKGWHHDSKIIISKIKSEYIFFWIEDHILINNKNNLSLCINEMKNNDVDQLFYSFYTKETRDIFKTLRPIIKDPNITVYNLDKVIIQKMKKKIKKDFYIVSCTSIMSKNFFTKVLSSKKPFLKRWPRHLPFDFEKKSNEFVVPIIRHALPNQELFAPIDDDHEEPGYSLISRGLYPNRVSREMMKSMEFGSKSQLKKKIKKLIPKKTQNIIAGLKNLFIRILYTLNIL